MDQHGGRNDHQAELQNSEGEGALNDLINLFPNLPADYIQLVFESEQKNVETAANRLIRCGGRMALTDNQQLA